MKVDTICEELYYTCSFYVAHHPVTSRNQDFPEGGSVDNIAVGVWSTAPSCWQCI